jgi:hypothetical protein
VENHEFSIRVDRRVFDIEELEYEVRSLVSGMVVWLYGKPEVFWETMNFP